VYENKMLRNIWIYERGIQKIGKIHEKCFAPFIKYEYSNKGDEMGGTYSMQREIRKAYRYSHHTC
jgi:hypothetical protein